MVGSSSSSRSGRDELRREADTPALAPGERRHQPRLRLLGVESEALEDCVDARVIDVPAEVGESLLIPPEALEEFVTHVLAHVAELHRLFGDAVLEGDDFAPGRRAGLPDGGGSFEGAMLV